MPENSAHRGLSPFRRPGLGRMGPVALATLAVTLPLGWTVSGGAAGRGDSQVTVSQHRPDVLARCLGDAARQFCIPHPALPLGEPVGLIGSPAEGPRLALRDEKAPPHSLVPELIDLPPPTG